MWLEWEKGRMRLRQRSSPQAWMGVGQQWQAPLRDVGCLLCRLRLDRNQPGVVDAQPGQRIRLTCHAEGFPPPTIEWQRDGQTLSSPRFVQLLSPPCCVAPSPTLPPSVQAGGRRSCQAASLVSQGLSRDGAAERRVSGPFQSVVRRQG